MIRKKPVVQALAALALLTVAAAAPAADAPQQSPGSYSRGYYGMQPGMMGGYGMGHGMMGPGMGMGPGMMGYGMGPGMMDHGYSGYGMGMMGMGHGMMGPGMGMGPGMMGGYGMGPGMMGMGPGMMGGYGPWGTLSLDAQQQKKITQIQDDLSKKHWDLMGKMNGEYAKLNQLYYSSKREPAAIGAQQQKIFDLQRQMMESSVEAQNRIDAVLTPEQKEQIQRFGYGGMMW